MEFVANALAGTTAAPLKNITGSWDFQAAVGAFSKAARGMIVVTAISRWSALFNGQWTGTQYKADDPAGTTGGDMTPCNAQSAEAAGFVTSGTTIKGGLNHQDP
jgi:hypothetical protein